MSVARAWILFTAVSAAAGAAAAALSGYEAPRTLLAAGVLVVLIIGGAALRRARRAGDETVLPACSLRETRPFSSGELPACGLGQRQGRVPPHVQQHMKQSRR